jgi:uncharacterized SAM-binding protein YcdF (DUF218 family)
MMHLIKQLVGELARPLVIAVLIGAVAVISRLRGWRRSAAWMSALAVVIAYLGALVPVGSALLGPLERQYTPLRTDLPLPVVTNIVVLGSGYDPRGGIPVTAALDEAGLVRIVEGIRLMRRLGATKLVVSGGAPPGHGRPAIGYAELARELGVSDSSLVILDSPRDTAAEARAVVELLGQSPFVLVTSAFHMPRAMRLMQRVGAHPIPAPTGQLADTTAIRWGDLLPNSGGLRRTELALHEYVGLAAITAHID